MLRSPLLLVMSLEPFRLPHLDYGKLSPGRNPKRGKARLGWASEPRSLLADLLKVPGFSEMVPKLVSSEQPPTKDDNRLSQTLSFPQPYSSLFLCHLWDLQFTANAAWGASADFASPGLLESIPLATDGIRILSWGHNSCENVLLSPTHCSEELSVRTAAWTHPTPRR